jgi:hypothetical protein
VPREVLAVGEVEVVVRQLDAEAPGRGIDGAQSFRHDFRADPVAGDDRDAMSGHCCSSEVTPANGRDPAGQEPCCGRAR